ncbi:MAG: acetyl-CoA carboxylase biotin carboxyl carrier protein [bacterium]|nr:acetyl-CoA carboxylase biotin carboxyl carrier protein [bacterium]
MVLTFEQIKELIELVATHRLNGVELERSGFRLKIEGHRLRQKVIAEPPPPFTDPAPVVVKELPAPPAAAPAPAAEEPGPAEVPSGAHVLTSPIVGTFYRAPSPDAPPFVDVGDRIKQGQVVCIVEAMKLMNEIEADVNGVVVSVLPKNAQPVEFGEPLLAVNPD